MSNNKNKIRKRPLRVVVLSDSEDEALPTKREKRNVDSDESSTRPIISERHPGGRFKLKPKRIHWRVARKQREEELRKLREKRESETNDSADDDDSSKLERPITANPTGRFKVEPKRIHWKVAKRQHEEELKKLREKPEVQTDDLGKQKDDNDESSRLKWPITEVALDGNVELSVGGFKMKPKRIHWRVARKQREEELKKFREKLSGKMYIDKKERETFTKDDLPSKYSIRIIRPNDHVQMNYCQQRMNIRLDKNDVCIGVYFA